MSRPKKQKTIFGHRLTRLMNERNMNNADLAELLGRERKYIITIRYSEKGPRLNELIILSKTFGVSIEYLAGLSDFRGNTGRKFFDQRWSD